jgi:hypothetical protein
LLDYTIGKNRMGKFDEILNEHPEKSTELFSEFDTDKVYHSMNLAEGNLSVTESLLRNDGFQNWLENLEKNKINKKFDTDPKLKKVYRDMDPRVRRACTFCESPCDIIEGITIDQANRLSKILSQLGATPELTPEWMRLKKIFSNTRKENSITSHNLVEKELDAIEASMIQGGPGLNTHLVTREREVVRETVGDVVGLNDKEMATLSDNAIDGLGGMSESELKALNGKSKVEIEKAGVERKQKIKEKSIALNQGFADVEWKKNKAIWDEGKLGVHHKKHAIERNEFGNISMNEYHDLMMNFLKEQGAFVEARLGNIIIKFDPISKRILIANAKNKQVLTFYKALPQYTIVDPWTDALDLAIERTGLSIEKLIYIQK